LDLGELGCGIVFLAVVAVWMQFESFPAVGFFNSGRRLEMAKQPSRMASKTYSSSVADFSISKMV
jgi:hypothetical protein